MGLISRVATTGLLALAVGGSYRLLTERHIDTRSLLAELNRGSSKESEHFSPAEDLEQIDAAELRAAARRLRGTQTPLNIAMYSFTDALIARLLVEEADAGTRVRIYRDGEQFEEEEHDHHGRRSVTSMLQGHRNIQIRVKPFSRSDLMHLKCWSDGLILRDGSANWSPAGLKRQDNEIRFTGDEKQVQEFNRDYERMWSRPGNIVVQ
jgi:phosphatidylserine/phosphatidylglycerophosphate/cardiolipin synthase-like enzyme